MSSGRKCKNCGGSDIEVDSARGDAVCTACGSVLEDTIIVAEVQFEEAARGTANPIGQFVAADSKGGTTKFGASFHVGGGIESREITLKKARHGISNLCSQLRLNQHCIDTACNFFKMALSGNLTKGRRNTHVYAACVYLTCRTEGTAHLLIDISDVLQICCYELGRTYLKLSQALCINIPAVDPCLYILRYAAKLQFGSKTQLVANTALRLVQRMKRDSIHSGRRPSGLCGAALLMASRLHEFNRSASDIVKIVKVHESTLRKRLIEFGDTPSSALTLDEFMTVDLEEEQDPPSFKAARKRDKERFQKLTEEEVESLTDLQKQIERQLEKDRKTIRIGALKKVEWEDEQRFIDESTMGTIEKIIQDENVDDPVNDVKGLGPDVESMGLVSSLNDVSNNVSQSRTVEINLADLSDIDDAEIDTYIMSKHEYECKNGLWHKRNAAFLEEQKAKQERIQKEREEGKPEKKKKRTIRKKNLGPSNSAGEAIEKILQEKKISSKINYDVLKSLNSVSTQPTPIEDTTVANGDGQESDDIAAIKSQRRRLSNMDDSMSKKRKGKSNNIGLPVFEGQARSKTEDTNNTLKKELKQENVKDESNAMSEEELDEYFEEEDQPPAESMGVLQMLRQHREGDDGEEEFGYGYGYDEAEDY